MNDNYKLFIELSLQQCTQNDYADKVKVRVHNEASKKLYKLKSKIKENCDSEMLRMLLNHEDERVIINAASLCLEMCVYSEEAVKILKDVIAFSKDSTLAFAAKNILNEHFK